MRSAEDVTARVTAAAEIRSPLPSIVAIEADSIEAAAAKVNSGGGIQPIEWAAARERIDGRDPGVAAVILVLRQPEIDPPQS